MREKLFLKKLIRDELQAADPDARKRPLLLFPEHHLSHAASAFYPSPFREAAILTIDGAGEWATASICHGQGKNIRILREMHFPHSLGLLYSAFTYFLGFKVNSGEYKLMGLAPYGDPEAEQTRRFADIIGSKLVSVKEDGSIWLDQAYFKYATGLRMVPDGKWERLFGFPRRKPEDPLEACHCNLAFAIQEVTEGAVLRMACEARRLTGSESLCLAGGVALNCVANGKIQRSGIFDNLFIQPAAGDAGGALGAAQAACHLHFGQDRALNFRTSISCAPPGNTRGRLTVMTTSTYWRRKSPASSTRAMPSDGSRAGWNSDPGPWETAASSAIPAIRRCRKN